MDLTMKFKATITTKASYPECMELSFKARAKDVNDIYAGAWEFIDNNIKDYVDCLLECDGVIFIHHAYLKDLQTLKEKGIKHTDGKELC